MSKCTCTCESCKECSDTTALSSGLTEAQIEASAERTRLFHQWHSQKKLSPYWCISDPATHIYDFNTRMLIIKSRATYQAFLVGQELKQQTSLICQQAAKAAL